MKSPRAWQESPSVRSSLCSHRPLRTTTSTPITTVSDPLNNYKRQLRCPPSWHLISLVSAMSVCTEQNNTQLAAKHTRTMHGDVYLHETRDSHQIAGVQVRIRVGDIIGGWDQWHITSDITGVVIPSLAYSHTHWLLCNTCTCGMWYGYRITHVNHTCTPYVIYNCQLTHPLQHTCAVISHTVYVYNILNGTPD